MYTAAELEKLEQEGKTCKDCTHYQACVDLTGDDLDGWPLCFKFEPLVN